MALARGQFWVVTREDLRGLGYGDDQIDRRLRRGLLHPVHRGVYVLGRPDLSRRAAWYAATRAVGPGCALCGGAAGALQDLAAERRREIEVLAPRRSVRHRRAGLLVRRRDFCDDEVTIVDRIPVTTPARTILDLARGAAPIRLTHLLERLEILGLFDLTALAAVIDRHPHHAGARRLSSAIESYRPDTRTRSELERLFLALLIEAGMPAPETNRWTDLGELDCSWLGGRVVVELDGWTTHRTREAFERDRRRRSALAARGAIVLSFTWRQVTEEPGWIAETIAEALALAAGSIRA